jgi:hypothetical protein
LYDLKMSTATEIQAALPALSNDDLKKVDAALREQYRERKIGILYDDSYGVWTEEDQVSAAAEVFAMMDKEERSEPS